MVILLAQYDEVNQHSDRNGRFFPQGDACSDQCTLKEMIKQANAGSSCNGKDNVDFKPLNGDERSDADRSGEMVEPARSRK
jgi:hypothetical protein